MPLAASHKRNREPQRLTKGTAQRLTKGTAQRLTKGTAQRLTKGTEASHTRNCTASHKRNCGVSPLEAALDATIRSTMDTFHISRCNRSDSLDEGGRIIEKFLTLETLCDARAHPYPPPKEECDSVVASWDGYQS